MDGQACRLQVSMRERVSRTTWVIETLVLPPHPTAQAGRCGFKPLALPQLPCAPPSLTACRPSSSVTAVRASRLPTTPVSLLQPVPLNPLTVLLEKHQIFLKIRCDLVNSCPQIT